MSPQSGDDLPASASRGEKRAREEGALPPTKAKRARYVTVACDACKRRKIRCNGLLPCASCDDLQMACSYQSDSRERPRDLQLLESMSTHMQAMNSKLDKLTQYVKTIQSGDCDTYTNDKDFTQISRSAGILQKRARSCGILDQPQSLCPGFRGPTSSSFIFEVADECLKKMGLLTAPTDRIAEAGRDTLPPTHQVRHRNGMYSPHRTSGTLQQLGQNMIVRLCESYDASIGILYPVLEMPRILRRAHLLFAQTVPFSDTEAGAGLSSSAKDDAKFEINMIKLISAASLACRGYADHARAETLYNDVDTEAPVWDAMGLEGLQYLTLVALYHVQMGQDVRASRIIGVAARLCLEMGLNRREVLERAYPEQHARDLAVTVFWSTYLLDMRASCGTGIPCVIQEVDVDPTLPEPNSSHLFLKTMISFARLSSKVWRVENSFTSPASRLAVDNIDLLDYQVLQWQKRMPESLRYDFGQPEMLNLSKREPLFARVIAHARLNQLRSLIYRRVLYSSSSITSHTLYAQTVVDIAKSTIALFTDLNHVGGLYQAHPVIFSHFVVSALGVFLLAVANAPEHFAQQCCSGYYEALSLLKQSAMESHAVLRLWKTVESLEELGPMLGITRTATPARPPEEVLDDIRPQYQSPGRGDLGNTDHSAALQFQSSDYRDDLASVFGFPLDGVDYGLFLSQDTNAGSGNGAQLSHAFDGLTYDSLGGIP